MKNIIKFSAITLTIFLSFNMLSAQKVAVKMLPTQIIFGKNAIQGEIAFSPRQSFALEIEKWNVRRNRPYALPMFGMFFSGDTKTQVNGYRVRGLVRTYTKQVMQGGFMEVGGYFGKHDVTITEESDVFDPFALVDFDLGNLYKSNVTVTTYKNLEAVGMQAGVGYQKSYGPLSMECVAGLSLNSVRKRVITEFKPITPYIKVGVGVCF